MKTKPEKHTPTPWFIDEDENGDRVIVDAPEAGIVIARNPNEENAAFIVRAVNNHEALIKIAKDQHGYYVSDYETSNNPHIESKCEVCVAIALAEKGA